MVGAGDPAGDDKLFAYVDRVREDPEGDEAVFHRLPEKDRGLSSSPVLPGGPAGPESYPVRLPSSSQPEIGSRRLPMP